MRHIASLAELKTFLGREVAVSDWVEMTQERVQIFADATGDRQWIHLDVERSRRESPYGGTVAHGFLTPSLLPVLMASTMRIDGVKMVVNYGLNKVRFPAPMPVGGKLRARFAPVAIDDIPGGAQLTWQVSMECDGSDKPVCVAESIVRCYA